MQSLPDATKGALGPLLDYAATQRGYILPPWGTRERERALRFMYRHEYNWLVQSAFAGLIKKVEATPWEIKGRRRVDYFADVLRRADFGRGWDSLLSKVLLDFLRQDAGGFVELIAPGNPRRAPTGPVTGVAPLDSLNCWPTGDPEYPVLYTNTDGRMHVLHHTRVLQLIDQPDSDQRRPGYGLCAMSRAASIAMRQILVGRYVEQKLDDKPPPGIVTASNLTEQQRNVAFAAYMREQGNDERPPWGRTMWLYGVDPEHEAKLDHLTFAQAPESWGFVEYTNLDVNAVAAALGVDVQEIWQLTGGNLGSGQQSQILHAKSQGKAYGNILTSLERLINQMLPDSLEFQFKRRDPFEAQERASTATLWASFVRSVGNTLSEQEQRRLLANMVEAYAGTVTDETGQILRRDDLDTEDPAMVPVDGVQAADDSSPNNPDAPTADAPAPPAAETTSQPAPVSAPPAPTPVENAPAPPPAEAMPSAPTSEPDEKPSREEVLSLLDSGLITIGRSQELLGQPVEAQFANWYMVNGTPVPPEVFAQLYETQFGRGVDTFSVAVDGGSVPAEGQRAVKSIDSTQAQFAREWADLIAAGRDDDMTRRRFGIVARALLAKYARRAYEDGLEAGGVEDGLDDDDLRTVAAFTAQQSGFVSDIGAVLFRGDGISDLQADQKPDLWWNKSIYPAFELGRASADGNGLYEWRRGETEQGCETCKQLDGQRHRLKEFVRRDLLPKSSRLQCQGFQCACTLVRSEGRARGRWPTGV